MEIDRRNLMTGLATSATAAILPAFPAPAVASGVRRFTFVDGPVFSGPSKRPPSVWEALDSGVWHYDPGADNLPLIRHVGTGLICRRVRGYPTYWAVQAIAIDTPQDAWPDADALALIGQASELAMFNAAAFYDLRRRHKGAVFYYWPPATPDDPYPLPVTEDAPPLSPDLPSGPPNRLLLGNRTVASFRPDRLFPRLTPD